MDKNEKTGLTGQDVASLVLAFGPMALILIKELVTLWSTPMTVADVERICKLADKDYDEFVNAARKAQG